MSVFERRTKPPVPAKTALATTPENARSTRVHPSIQLQRSMGNQAVRRMLQRSTAAHPLLANRQLDVIPQLQGTIGNRAVGRLLQQNATDSIPLHQTKLTVSEPGDAYEQEADRVADQVVRMTGRPETIGQTPAEIQRMCAGCRQDTTKEEEEKEEEKRTAIHRTPSLHQSLAGREDEYADYGQSAIFRKAEFVAAPQRSSQTASIADRLEAKQGGGQPLPATTLHRMEAAFGRDFSGVRVHQDAEAGEFSRQLSALAFTQANHIYFSSGMFDPEGSSGQRLLAHELTHVVQQGHAPEQREIEGAAAQQIGPQAAAPGIQRVANWAAGAVHQVNNLADSIINGPPVGITFPALNGTVIRSTADAQGAIVAPTLSFAPAASGGINASVATVPTNTGSFDETVLAPGPWTVSSPKATIGAMFPSLAACTGAGNSTFRAIGDPNDAHMFAANRRHEDHHAADHHVAFNLSIKIWDAKLTLNAGGGTTFNGATKAGAEAALYAAMGGTPQQVAFAYWTDCLARGGAFHGTPAGGPVGAPTSPTANADCSSSSAKFHNPS